MDTIPFHWDTLDAPQCLRMACLCPDECHEDLVCRLYQRRHRRLNKSPPAAKVQALRGARLKALLALDFCLFMRGRSCNSFIQVGIFSVVVRAIHLTVNMPLRMRVGVHRVFPLTPFQGLEPFSGPA